MSVTDAILFRARPGVRNPEQLVEIRMTDRSRRSGRLVSFRTYERLEETELGLSGLAAGAEFQASTSIGPETSPVLVAGATATRNLFSVLDT
ncbi:MAG: hypothetical protein PVH00_09290, partial [Gemmatimonadota bacterium]